jgi:hypothetical protein
MEASRKTIEFDEPTHDEPQGDVDDLTSKLRMLGDVVESNVRNHMRERPYAVVGIAFGVGYVLGGGLPRMAIRALSAMALRYAAFEALRRAGVVPDHE